MARAGGALDAAVGVAGAVDPGLLPAFRVTEKLAVAYRCAESAARTTTLLTPIASGMLLMFQLVDAPVPFTTTLPFSPPLMYQFIRQGPVPAFSAPQIESAPWVVSVNGVLNDKLNGDAGAAGNVVGSFGVGVGTGVGVGVEGGVVGVSVAEIGSA